MTSLILIIDPSPTIRKILETIMRREGYRAISFVDGFAALQWLASPAGRVPALVLLDIALPRMDGYSVLRRLKARLVLNAVPLIVLTSRDGVVDRLKARLAGASVYLLKPFTTRQIIAVVREHLPDGEEETISEAHPLAPGGRTI